MFITNLSAVSAASFAATPQDSEDTLQDLINLLSNSQTIYINSDGTVADTSNLDNLQSIPEKLLEELRVLLSQTSMDCKFTHICIDGNRIYTDPPVRIDMAGKIGLIQDPVSKLDTPQTVSKISTDEKTFAAVPWYESDSNLVYRGTDLHLTGKQLWENEKKAMLRQFPQAKTGIMKTTGELYWIVPVDINIGSTTKRWTFMLKYDNNHPHADDWGGSVKAIPMIPSIDELESRAKAAGRINSDKTSMCTHLPHMWRDYNDHILYLDTASKHTQAELLDKHTILSAAAVMGRAIRWACYYEVGLLDTKVWDEFCGFHNRPECLFSPSDAADC